ncbi:MAG: hypothetical protein HY078_13865 [Elusimicrobia bacterium]|nr:hypothetical protein [Elusimicrobiota bacterium]
MMPPRELDSIKVATPCTQSWDAMAGDDKVRFCSSCRLNVYNLSSMSRAEAESFVALSEGRMCVAFYRRADGKILTQDCPVGMAGFRRRLSKLGAFAIGLVVVVIVGAIELLRGKASNGFIGCFASDGKSIGIDTPRFMLGSSGGFVETFPSVHRPAANANAAITPLMVGSVSAETPGAAPEKPKEDAFLDKPVPLFRTGKEWR